MAWRGWRRRHTQVRDVKVAAAATSPPSTLVLPKQPHAATSKTRSRQRGLRSDTATPFSRLQCVLAVVAYILLLSNFARTDFAISNLDAFRTTEPNVYVNFGPYAYGVNTFTKNDSGVAAAKSAALWSYKFDTTSLAMRAFAEYLRVSAFPPCVLYRGKCTGTELAPDTAFSMLDALVDAIRTNASSPTTARFVPETMTTIASTTASATKLDAAHRDSHQHLEPQRVLLRASYDFFDRIHHYLMPQLFSTPAWRTCHALYYSTSVLESAASARVSAVMTNTSRQQPQQHDSNRSVAGLCSRAYNEVRPFFCEDHWANFARSCAPSKPKCRAVGRVSLHIAQRLATLMATYPSATVDVLVIEGNKDLALHRGSFAFVARRGADVTTIVRVRDCSSDKQHCSTRLLDDYRYEGDMFTTDILKWRVLVVALRSVAQSYYWLRLAMLLYGCYIVAATNGSDIDSNKSASKSTGSTASRLSRCFHTSQRALAIFFKVPSQVVIYGSLLPLASYLLAHAIDASMTYDLIGHKFDSFNGLLHLSVAELLMVSSVQMRNVWVLGCVAHAVVRASTSRYWSPTDGVWGMPQLSIALISSVTIVSQFRFVSLRYSPMDVIQHIPVATRLHPNLESLLSMRGGGGKAELTGVFMDVKAMTCSIAALAVIASTGSLLIEFVIPKAKVKLVFWRAYSVTPLSAGVLWPASAFAVSWNDDFFNPRRVDSAIQKRKQQMSLRRLINTVSPYVSAAAAAAKSPSAKKRPRPPSTQTSPSTAQTAGQTQRREQLPTTPVHFDTLDDRSEVVESAMYLMNIAMLSDPMTFLAWRFGLASKMRLGYYRSTATQHVYLVPLQHTTRRSGLDWSGFVLERTVCAGELSWSEIITCG